MYEPADDIENIVRMNGCEYKVTGKCRLNGYLSSLGIPDLTYHYLVRIVSEYRAKSSCKGKSLFLIHWYLYDASEKIFDRILNGDYLLFAGMYFSKCGIKGCSFSGACRPGDEDHSVRLPYHFPETFDLMIRHSEDSERQPFEVACNALFVQNPYYCVLSESTRHDRNTKIN